MTQHREILIYIGWKFSHKLKKNDEPQTGAKQTPLVFLCRRPSRTYIARTLRLCAFECLFIDIQLQRESSVVIISIIIIMFIMCPGQSLSPADIADQPPNRLVAI